MACASCGGGRQMTPNQSRNLPQPQYTQSPNRIITTPQGARGNGGKVETKPNQPKRTQV